MYSHLTYHCQGEHNAHMMMNHLQMEASKAAEDAEHRQLVTSLAEKLLRCSGRNNSSSGSRGAELFITDNLCKLFSDDAVYRLVTGQSMMYARQKSEHGFAKKTDKFCAFLVIIIIIAI